MFEDFIEEWLPAIFFGAIVIGLIALVVVLIKQDDKAEAVRVAACAHAMSVARTSADSVAVVLRCEMPEKSAGTTVVPMPIIIPSR